METDFSTAQAQREITAQKLLVYGRNWSVPELLLDVKEQRLAEEIAADMGLSPHEVRRRAGTKLRKKTLNEADLATKTVAELWIQMETTKQLQDLEEKQRTGQSEVKENMERAANQPTPQPTAKARPTPTPTPNSYWLSSQWQPQKASDETNRGTVKLQYKHGLLKQACDPLCCDDQCLQSNPNQHASSSRCCESRLR